MSTDCRDAPVKVFIERVKRKQSNLSLPVFLFCLALLVLVPVHGQAAPFFQPVEEMWYYRRAVGLLESGDYELARQRYRTFLNNYPHSDYLPRVYFGLAETYYLKDGYDSASTYYLESLRTGNLPSAYVDKAFNRGLESVVESGRLSLGGRYVKLAGDYYDTLPERVSRWVVRVQARRGKPRKALERALPRFDRSSDREYWRYEVAQLRARIDQYDTALELLEPLTKRSNPYRKKAIQKTASLYYKKGNYKKSRRYYRQLLHDTGYRFESLYELARIDIKQRKFDSATKRLARLTESSRNLELRETKQLILDYLMAEKYKKAIELIKKQQQRGKLETPPWNRRLAKALYQEGKYRQALEILPDVQNLPDTADEKLFLSLEGSLYFQLKKWDKSLKVYDRLSRKSSGWEPRYYWALNKLLIILRDRGKYRELGQYIPDVSKWSHWDSLDAEPLGLAISEYYRSTERYQKGLKRLHQLEESLTDLSETTAAKLEEWKASFEIELGRHSSARRRLSRIPADLRTSTGTLNLAVAEYHTGDTSSSWRRIRKLYRQNSTKSVTLYDYGFRILRDRKRSQQLGKWTRSFLAGFEYNQESVESLTLKNVQYWVNNGSETTALSFLDTLASEADQPEQAIPLKFYRGLAHFNKGQPRTASRHFEELRAEYSLPDKWKKRVLRTQMQVHLRLNNWKTAYGRWNELRKIGSGGKMGLHLLSEEGLESSPGTFDRFLSIMESNYSGSLPPGERLFWRGRLAESQENFDLAIQKYEQYLSKNYENHQIPAGIRIARLHGKTGHPGKAIPYYKKLYRWTEKPIYRLKKAVHHRKAGELQESKKILKTLTDESNSLRNRATYQLAYVSLRQNEYQSARRHFERVLKGADTTTERVKDARIRFVEISLKTEKMNGVSNQLKKLDTGPRAKLYRAEYHRQSGNLEKAVRTIEALRTEKIKGSSVDRDQYRSIASSIYWQSDNYSDLLNLYDELPTSTLRQKWYLKSLVHENQLKKARRIYPDLNPEFKPEAASVLGDAHYSRSKWSFAVKYYKEAEGSPRATFRIGNSYRKLGDPQKALKAWKNGLNYFRSKKNPSNKWINPIIQGVASISKDLKSSTEPLQLLDEHWSLPFSKKDEIANQAMKVAVQAQHDRFVRPFLTRVNPPDTAQFKKIAGDMADREYWGHLKRWTRLRRTGVEDSEDTLAAGYYRSLVKIKTNTETDSYPDRVNTLITKATEQKSPFALKLQRLLGDYYFKHKEYDRAAIEYRKIELLYDVDNISPEVKLKLASSYDKLDKRRKARKIFQELSGDTVKPEVRKEALRWLSKNSDES